MASVRAESPSPTLEAGGDRSYQEEILQGVSRTFALTIPQLPKGLRAVVGNAYLLCRIADTIEDSETLTLEDKSRFGNEFVQVTAGEADAEAFARSLAPRLGGRTLEAERRLVADTARVIRVTRSFSPEEQAALVRCVRIMAEGMEAFQEGQFTAGLRDVAHLEDYCYHVAGVVGEMLTELFCLHSPATARRREALTRRAVAFGQGLQMTNILKDLWDDKQRGVCWLPRDVFLRHGFDLSDLSPDHHGAGFQAGLGDLVALARRRLEEALEYTLLIPRRHAGIRRFCLWALAMALLTLQNIHRRRDFTSAQEVKITRRQVKAVIAVSQLIGGSNAALRAAFAWLARGLPR